MIFTIRTLGDPIFLRKNGDTLSFTVNWPEDSVERLAQACRAREPEAWEEFIRRFHPVISAAAVRVSRRWGSGIGAEIDDIVQEIYLKFCEGERILTEFDRMQPNASFAYIKIVATNLAHDYFRHRFATKRGESITGYLSELVSEDRIGQDIERTLTVQQVERVLDQQTQGEKGARDRAIFRLYYQQGLTAQAISELPGSGLTTKGVEGVLYRLVKGIRESFAAKKGSHRG